MRTRSHSPALSGPGRSQIEFDTPSRPKPCTSPARRSVSTCSGGNPSSAAGLLRQVSDRDRMTQGERRLQVHEVRDGRQRAVELLRRQRYGQRGLGGDHGLPRGTASRPPRISSGLAHSSAARAGSNCLPARLRASAVAPATPPTR